MEKVTPLIRMSKYELQGVDLTTYTGHTQLHVYFQGRKHDGLIRLESDQHRLNLLRATQFEKLLFRLRVFRIKAQANELTS